MHTFIHITIVLFLALAWVLTSYYYQREKRECKKLKAFYKSGVDICINKDGDYDVLIKHVSIKSPTYSSFKEAVAYKKAWEDFMAGKKILGVTLEDNPLY